MISLCLVGITLMLSSSTQTVEMKEMIFLYAR